MAELIAYCGLVCDTCPIYLATRQEDREEQARMRAEIARFCNEKYGTGYAPADINDCESVPALKKALNDRKGMVRTAASEALGAMKCS